MACPKCKCKVTYKYDDDYDGALYTLEGHEKCAACGHIFDAELDGLDDDDYDNPTT